MKHEAPPPLPALSLQNKLDQIAHDRDVLFLLRDLARHGLREGDTLHHTASGVVGRLAIAREDEPPRIVVVVDGGTREAFSTGHWRRGPA